MRNRSSNPASNPTANSGARGKLRIYFGASVGVGKTHAMLIAARAAQASGVNVVIGAFDSGGCAKLGALLDGMPVLAQHRSLIDGHAYAEFDLAGALALRPSLLALDELAHTNAPGSRHKERWHDIEELLEAGIDVLTTLKVQDLESLNDVIGGITGTRVTETLPDSVFDEADEVVLVDVPVEELMQRLAKRQDANEPLAVSPTLSKGKLIALRELALRRMAERVEDDVQAYRIAQSIRPVWKSGTAILACVSPHAGADHVVRSTARLAGQLNASWHAIYVETPQLQHLSHARRERILQTLKLAESLGANTTVVVGNDISLAIIDYARQHNFSKIVLGHSHRSWIDFTPWHKERLKRIAALAPDIDLIEIGRWHEDADANATLENAASTAIKAEENVRPYGSYLGQIPRHQRYLLAASASLLTTLITLPLVSYLELANITMLFLLTVVLVSVRYGRGSSVVATIVAVAALAFVTPRFSFGMSDLQYTVTVMVMLAVGLITGKLTADLRYQSAVASHREVRARALYEFSRALSGALQTEQIVEITRTFVQRCFHAQSTLLLPDETGALQLSAAVHMAQPDTAAPQIGNVDRQTAQWAFDHALAAGASTDTMPDSTYFFVPLNAPMRTRGMLAIALESRHWLLIPEQRKQLDTFATLAAIALERVHYVDVAQSALVRMESERLRNSLLAAISHDLRTPLTSLVGLSESLAMSTPPLSAAQSELAQSLRDEAMRMNNLVSNLLDMARIQSGLVKLNLQWQALEEVVGSALRASRVHLRQHQVQVGFLSELPLVHFDSVLIERVFCNLLENAVKYTPEGSCITINAEVKAPYLSVQVSDNGPGIQSGREEAIFDKFTRGERESAKPGVGLGLSICRAIVEAHRGVMVAKKSSEGARFVFTLPLGTPPEAPVADESDSLNVQ